MHLKEFFAAVFSSWVEAVGIILTILPFVEKIPRIKAWLQEKPILERYAWLLWVVGGICIVYGFYNAWNEQREKTLTAEAKLEELTRPRFEISYGTIAVGEMHAVSENRKKDKHTAFFLPVTVLNRGAQSVIRGWTLTAQLPDGTKLQGSPFIPAEFTFKGMTFSPSSSLFRRGTASPIVNGGQADGFVMFVFPAGLADKMAAKGSSFSLKLYDITNKEYEVRLSMEGVPATEFLSPPGIRPDR
jgi:hypothetical protein